MKVISMTYSTPTDETRAINSSWTGVILHLEDGTKLAQQSTDIVKSYEPVDNYWHVKALEVALNQIQKEQKQLFSTQQEIEAVKEEEVNKSYFFLGTRNELNIICSENGSVDQERQRVGNFFPTEQKAEYERLRRECMATRWVPEDGDSYCVTIIDNHRQATLTGGGELYACIAEVILGLAAPKPQEAKARWDKYGEAWLDVLKT